MTFTVAVSATTTTISIPGTAPAAAGFHTRLLTADGIAVVAEQTRDDTSFSFPGIPAGSYVAEMSRLDVNGNVIGTPVTAPFDAVEPAPADVTITVPAGLAISVTKE